MNKLYNNLEIKTKNLKARKLCIEYLVISASNNNENDFKLFTYFIEK